ncbi:uncharacterized protein LOC128552742 [Mercenaria mercenaria]|uniref:uncharacterized protein LOC128552742 n=1 Tax=Mercenaria mercenaria TaxID=6596 RepID=UPI00234F61DC|nr:uncharacterized protein LOC128552742 [Mercenaria mercenaria]
MRESGICVEGCTGSYNGPVCGLRSGKPQDASADTSTVAVIAVLATLLVVTSTALCMLMLKKLVKKIRSPDRQPEQSMVQIYLDNSMVEEQNIHNECHTAVSEEDNVAYESLDKTQAPEHTYDTAPESTVNVRNVEYENVQL